MYSTCITSDGINIWIDEEATMPPIDRECYMYGADVRQELKQAWYRRMYGANPNFTLYNRAAGMSPMMGLDYQSISKRWRDLYREAYPNIVQHWAHLKTYCEGDVKMSLKPMRHHAGYSEGFRSAETAVNPPIVERVFTIAGNKHGWEVIGRHAEQFTVLALAGTGTAIGSRSAYPFKIKRVQSFNKPGTGREYISLFYGDGTPVNGGDIRLVDRLPPAPPKPVVNHRHTVRLQHGMLNGSQIPTKMVIKAFRDFKTLTPDLEKGEEVEVTFRTLRPVPEELIKKRTIILDKFARPEVTQAEVARMVSQFMWVNDGSDEFRVSIEGRSLPRK